MAMVQRERAGEGAVAAEHLWPHEESSASLSEWEMDLKPPESPSVVPPDTGNILKGMCCSCGCAWGVFPCHAEPE